MQVRFKLPIYSAECTLHSSFLQDFKRNTTGYTGSLATAALQVSSFSLSDTPSHTLVNETGLHNSHKLAAQGRAYLTASKKQPQVTRTFATHTYTEEKTHGFFKRPRGKEKRLQGRESSRECLCSRMFSFCFARNQPPRKMASLKSFKRGGGAAAIFSQPSLLPVSQW